MFTPDQTPPLKSLGDRLRLIRVELFGADGVAALAHRLGISARQWSEIESNDPRPSVDLLLRFVELTRADPVWVFIGRGQRYRNSEELSG